MISRNVIGRGIVNGLSVVAVLTFILNLLALVLPLYMLQVYDRVLTSASLSTLGYLTLIAVAILIVLGAIEAIRQVVVQRVGTRLEIDVGEKLLVASLKAGGQAQDATGQIRDLAQVRSFLASPVFSALLDAPFAPLFLLIVFMIHPMLGALVLGGIVILLMLTLMNQWALSGPQRKSGDAAATAGNLVVAFARSGEALRAMGMARAAIAAWGEKTADALNAQDRATRANAVFSGMSRSIRLIVQLGILGLGAFLTLRQEITAGMIFATSLVAARALAPVDNLIGGWKGLLQSLSSLRRIDQVLRVKGNDPPRTRLPAPTGHLAFEKIIYVPEGAAEPTVKGIVLTIEAGEAVCIVGPSGAGKSTFARLAAGALQPSHGRIRLDGSDVENWEPDERGRHVGYLPQDVELLPYSIARNIARLDDTATAEEIMAAADLAGVMDLVKKLPDGFDTRVGPGGLPLSGGQRQRIALARAVFRRPRVVVLDEPNAHLDTEGEAALNRTIAQLKRGGTTVIVVSQRAGVLQSVDRVLFMRDGQIAASQSREEALARVSPAVRSADVARAAQA
ncbi:type I secretion system permease/ATPase [Bradyrhizobium sp. LHD-71]|uniref:type I secretion system permease/ATPase n=1 Tax=Bradyrhizobium sp. LHD-71 TaxID=3072141 RepID=UPI00280E670E|nr:type I secretion system permease/ATPase [Bradyrhizobium sp. LHD-71]MDQ8732119.1 type I secretion system permease/ATPase [Bradyrhizobium sp. LHD-71]